MVKSTIIDLPVEHPCVQCNPSMKLIFDILTPRPHFILLHRDQYRKLNVTENEIHDAMELVTQFLTHKSEYDNNAILSFHRGKWYQQNIKEFHAHLCVSRKPYCREVKLAIDASRCLSSIDYLKQMHDEYLFSKIRYNQYREQCLSKASFCFNDPISSRVPLKQFNTSKFTLVYLASTPRIGIISGNIKNNLQVLYHFMNEFYFSARKKLSSINPSFENFGVHLCLYVSSNGKKGKNAKHRLTERSDRVFSNNESEPIQLARLVGYIQMDEQLYLRWLPAPLNRVWLNEFQNRQHLVLT